MAQAPVLANQTLAPPRRSGDDKADMLQQIRWFNDFYDQYTKVLNVPGVIKTLTDAGLLDAPAGFFTSVTTQLATLTTQVAALTDQLTALQQALTSAGIIPITLVPGLNATAIQLLVHNDGGVQLQPVTLTVDDGGGVGFRAIVVPN